MKRKLLLTLVIASLTPALLLAQKRSQKKLTTAYAITGVQKGHSSWTEVRLVDVNTGQEIQTVYQSAQETEALNARTGKPIVKKEITNNNEVRVYTREKVAQKMRDNNPQAAEKKIIDLDEEVAKKIAMKNDMQVKRIITTNSKLRADKPFSTTSAACAYDKKHNRLYYTPMGINQLRYIDLSSGAPRFYYFEDESFGALSGRSDVPNQITRMVIAGDGNGYALTNNGNHLIRFTTGKKPVITDLGSLTDDAANGSASIHSSSGYGGDMVADTKKSLYLITANRNVFKIDIETRVATFKGAIQGLPKGYSTNGAVVDNGTTIIVSSSQSTQGYYKFDLNGLQATKLTNGDPVYNASDLANANLISEKKKKKERKEAEPQLVVEETAKPEVLTDRPVTIIPEEMPLQNKISVFPNPVTTGVTRISFEDHPQGRYQIQMVDITGKVLRTQQLTIANRVQVEEFRLPSFVTRGNYLIKVIGEGNKTVSVSKLAVH